jgi:hypothetical protein
MKLKHWHGFPGVFAREAMPVLEFLLFVEGNR